MSKLFISVVFRPWLVPPERKARGTRSGEGAAQGTGCAAVAQDGGVALREGAGTCGL